MIWDNGTRAQLIDFLDQQRSAATKETFDDIKLIHGLVANFEFDAHKYNKSTYCLIANDSSLSFSFYRCELEIGGVFIRIYNDMPSFPIVNPKQFTMDLLLYLKQAYQFITLRKAQTIMYSESRSGGGDGILKPTLAANHPQFKQVQQQQEFKSGSTFDEVLNAYNRSKSRKKSENETIMDQRPIQSQCIHDFLNTQNVEKNIIMVLKALIAVIKANAEVEVKCIGNFDMIFAFLSNNVFKEVSS